MVNNGGPGSEVNFEKNEMIEYPIWYDYPASSWTWEILSSFFANHQLTPIFIDCNDTSGWRDKDTGLWNGAVALVN